MLTIFNMLYPIEKVIDFVVGLFFPSVVRLKQLGVGSTCRSKTMAFYFFRKLCFHHIIFYFELKG